MCRNTWRVTAPWALGAALVAAGSPIVLGGQQAPTQTPAAGQPAAQAQQAPAPPSPVQLANTAERLRIMKELKISAIPPGAVGNSPATYNEAEANPYPDLPDPLTLKNGRKVTTAAMWKSQRRAEVLEDFQREIYGRTPKNVPKVTWKVVRTLNETDGDIPVVTKQLVGVVDNSVHPSISVLITATLTTPANATRGVPVIIQFGGGNFPLPDGMTAPPNACAQPGAFGARGAGPGAAGRQGGPPPSAGPTWQQQLLAKGWGYAAFNPGSVQGDCGAGLTSGIIGLVNKGQPRKLDDWGSLSAWGWGASRLLDYFETDKAVDARRVGVTGHSRFGKAALVGMAFDERFAIGYISSSGQGGAKLHRRKYGETIENVANSFYHWMAGNYLKYTARWDTMPVDSHELIALCAPRPVFLSAGNNPGPVGADGTVATNDAWVDAKGSFLAAVGAGPVYKLLGAKDLGTTEFPAIDTAIIEGDLGFRQHTGGHTPGPTWPTFITFASKYFDKASSSASRQAGVSR
jgi:hypothetical protein